MHTLPRFHDSLLATAAGILVFFSSWVSGDEPDFERDVAPLMVRRCLVCHTSVDPSGGLDLTKYETLMRGGESGLAIDSDPKSSFLLKRLINGEMPPEKNGRSQALPEVELAVFRNWIEAGTKWTNGRVLNTFERTNSKRAGRDWWAWQPLNWNALESISKSDNYIDHFVLQKLNKQQLSLASPADPRTLLRRVYFDLTGLSPTADEVASFEENPSSSAYERIVDRLLESDHFGERWARHWLDLVRFAETNGYERDAVKPNAWRYRDWVINAINSDMPYDQFVTEQLAGDEIPNSSESSVIATGFLRLGTWDDEPNDLIEYQYERLEDMVHATTTAFLAMTVKCARCHDHKFDAIPQTDYYRVAASFWGGPVAHRKREWNGGPTKEELGYDVLGWTDLGREPPHLHLLKKGDIHRPMQIVAPGGLSGSADLDREFAPSPPDAKTAYRRLQLAQWIVDKRNPLTARVIVNRLWQHHFGEGLVRTPDNFGFLGNPPTHPDLLDALAADLMAGGWKLKRIHKLMVMSQVYRQSSIHPKQIEFLETDASNRFWWRAERRRLDAEQIRDSLLQCSGRLDKRIAGPSFMAPISDEALEGLSMKTKAYKASDADDARRRSIYMFSKRSLAVPMMTVFDSCDTTAPTGRRDVSTVAPQALTLLNNEWVHGESKAMAQRVIASSAELEHRVVAAWRIAVARSPTVNEKHASIEFVKRSQAAAHEGTNAELAVWSAFCHTLFNTNEFVYLD
ncbi:MAG TPA: PSD1 and planctomycete cytochrome C domain-containing protein [Pirellula sp.]|nr:PSD1 and planctomycete cytochrome C domain-containing protein [Pirellula sp.]